MSHLLFLVYLMLSCHRGRIEGSQQNFDEQKCPGLLSYSVRCACTWKKPRRWTQPLSCLSQVLPTLRFPGSLKPVSLPVCLSVRLSPSRSLSFALSVCHSPWRSHRHFGYVLRARLKFLRSSGIMPGPVCKHVGSHITSRIKAAYTSPNKKQQRYPKTLNPKALNPKTLNPKALKPTP